MEPWAELRREHFQRGVSITEPARRTVRSRNTVRAAIRYERPPSCSNHLAGPASTPTTADLRTSSPRSAASCGWAGSSVGHATLKRRASLNAGRAPRGRHFEPGRVFANELDFPDQFDAWATKVRQPQWRTVDRLARSSTSADRALTFSFCAGLTDPDLVGRPVEVIDDRRSPRRADTGASLPAPSVLRAHRTITALQHARRSSADATAATASPVLTPGPTARATTQGVSFQPAPKGQISTGPDSPRPVLQPAVTNGSSGSSP